MPEPLELAIDTASETASIALTSEGALLGELTWQAGRQHSRQLLPAVDSLLRRLEASKEALTAVFICTGPGSYAGIRSGMSAAKGLAFGLETPIVGVGRLEIEAYAFAAAGGPVVAVHRAGRRELAWAAYIGDSGWRELAPPTLVPNDALVDALPDGSLVTGEIEDDLARRLIERGHRVATGSATVRRAALLAELAWRRMRDGATDDPKTLVPLYLREPAIGPQT